MIVEFLNKLYSESLEEKIKLESKYQEFKIKLDQNEKYIQKLKKNEEETVDVFSPRKQNRNFHNNIVLLEKEQHTLLSELETYNGRIATINARLKEFKEAIQIAKQREIQNNMISQTEQNEERQIQSDLEVSDMIYFIIHKIELCTKFVNVDPARCKIELTSLKQKLIQILEKEEDSCQHFN